MKPLRFNDSWFEGSGSVSSRLAPAAALCLLFAGWTANAQEAAVDKELQTLRAEVRTLKEENARLRARLQAVSREGAARPAEVALDPLRAVGNRQAKVGIVEFSDYQCPYCRRFHDQTFETIKRKYIDSGVLLYSYRDFPLDSRPEARSAAVAANCAGRQGAYWAMQRRLFSGQEQLGRAYYEHTAKAIQLDTQAFSACLTDANVLKAVQQDVAYAQSLGVYATPHFFVGRVTDGVLKNVTTVNGAQSFETFAQVIDGLLKRQE